MRSDPESRIDVLISHHRDDTPPAHALAKSLESRGWSVRVGGWNGPASPGEDWAAAIDETIASVGCLVALWSQSTKQSRWMREEAQRARRLGKLVSVRLPSATTMPDVAEVTFPLFGPIDGSAEVAQLGNEIARILARSQAQEPASSRDSDKTGRPGAEGQGKTPPPRRRRIRLAAIARGIAAAVIGLAACWWSFSMTSDLYTSLALATVENTPQAVCMPRPGLAPEMVLLPGGTFQMGSATNEPERGSGESQHQVLVERFAIGRCEVTFAEYDHYVEDTGVSKPDDYGWGRGRRPVVDVSWKDAIAYAEWLSKQTGETYRLPTESEWEYAARGGTQTAFWVGDTIDPTQANYDGESAYAGGDTGEYRHQTVEVGKFEANPFGLHDVHGNVWEWTCSAYNEGSQRGETRCAAVGSGGSRVLRGGSWYDPPRLLRSAKRFWHGLAVPNSIVGFRLARSVR